MYYNENVLSMKQTPKALIGLRCGWHLYVNMNVQYITLLRLENDNVLVENCYIFLVCDPKHKLCGTPFALKHILWVPTIFVIVSK